MKLRKMLAIGFVVLGAFLAVQLAAGSHPPNNSSIFEFTTMAPVTRPYTGTTNPIRGVPGGGLPWTISSAKGELKTDGKLEIKVTGLVLADDPAVPVALRLTNPIPFFRATVSCLSIDSNTQPTTVNVSTDAFPASPSGDSSIETTVSLPTPCFAPIVFVTSPTGAWFAVTGN